MLMLKIDCGGLVGYSAEYILKKFLTPYLRWQRPVKLPVNPAWRTGRNPETALDRAGLKV